MNKGKLFSSVNLEKMGNVNHSGTVAKKPSNGCFCKHRSSLLRQNVRQPAKQSGATDRVESRLHSSLIKVGTAGPQPENLGPRR